MNIEINHLEQQEKMDTKGYHHTVHIETLADGQRVFVVRCVELLGCLAQGNTLEAVKAFEAVLFDYILSCLEDGFVATSLEEGISL